jgi:hypothetical protein
MSTRRVLEGRVAGSMDPQYCAFRRAVGKQRGLRDTIAQATNP